MTAVGAPTGSSTPCQTHPHAHEAAIISGIGALRLEEQERHWYPATYFRQPRRAHAIVNQGSEALRLVCLHCYGVEAHCNTRDLVGVPSCVQLSISAKTVGNHVEHIYSKIGVSSRRIDAYEPAIRGARAKAQNAEVHQRVRFEVADAAGLPARFNIITTFDVIHDSADPRGLLRAIHDALEPPVATYAWTSIAQKTPRTTPEPSVRSCTDRASRTACRYHSPLVGPGLGTLGQPPSRLSEVAHEAGFSHVRQVPIDDPFNNLYELTP